MSNIGPESRARVGIVGAGGYTGGELIRLLINHRYVEIISAGSQSQAGKFLYETHPDLLGETSMVFSKEVETNLDYLFLCMGHGESKQYLENHSFPSGVKIIDLSQDFRLNESLADRKFVYGLPELNRDKIKTAQNIANPGCFATAIQLSLLPLITAGVKLLSDITLFGVTGSTGAGRGLSETSHFTWRTNNLSVYKAFQHQHLAEIRKSFLEISPSLPPIHFIPQRGNFSRGILVSVVLKTYLDLNEVKDLYQEFYSNEPFVFISDKTIDLKSVCNTNKVFISFEKQGEELLINTSLDNLIKGASGQAIQNMNLMAGFHETEGLKLKSIAY